MLVHRSPLRDLIPLIAGPLLKLVVFEESLEGKTAMMLNWITSDGVSNHALAELPDLRKRTDGFLWLDIPEWRDEAEEILTNEFHFHPLAITESKNRSHIPRVHVYPDHVHRPART